MTSSTRREPAAGDGSRRLRSMTVRRAAAKVAVKAAEKQGKTPDPTLVALATSR